jgi:fused signal recognition particle receptor
MGFLGKFFAKFSRNEFTPEDERDLANVLIESDLGNALTEKILAAAKSQPTNSQDGERAISAVRAVLRSSLMETDRGIFHSNDRPTVILIVGVNGTGKTTSVAKLAKWLSENQKKVLLAAADTFRAAAVEQLSTWADRLEIPIVVGETGADPASVAFEAASRAVNENFSFLIIDTAGRLHTKSNLMDELSKIKRVVEKITPINETLFVLDGTTGQNGIVQAKTFAQSVPLTGLIVTKLDGSAKGGIALATEMELKTPIKFIGTGEREGDFAAFDPEIYVESLLS